MLGDDKSEKEILKEEFEVISVNIKNILSKKTDKINVHEKDLILSAIKVPPPSPRKSASSNHPLMSSPTPSPNSSTASDFSTMKRMESCLRKEKWEKIFLLFWKVYFV